MAQLYASAGFFGRGVLSHALSEKDVPTLAASIARSLGLGELSAPREEQREEAAALVGWRRTVTTTRWSAGGFVAALIVASEGHEHEGGGDLVSAVLNFPGGVFVALEPDLERYAVFGEREGAARAERTFLDALGSLGFSATPWLEWAGGRVLLDPASATVRFESERRSWSVELPADEGIMVFLDSRAEVHGGMLLVWTSCEHGNAGGGPFLFRLHRVREDGTIAWTRTVDLLPRPHRIRVADGALEVYAAWTSSLADRDLAARWTRLDADTGAEINA